MAFATLFSHVGALLFGMPSRRGADEVEAELVRLTVEAIVDAVDPRLRMLAGYQKKIATGAARTITHLRSIARDLPEPIVLARDAWGPDPLLNALFATANDLPPALGRSDELRAFFESSANAAVREACALLGMLKTERTVLAPAMIDGALRQDVPQTTVSFSGHRLIAPALDLAACRREVGERILKRLAALVLERITALSERAVELDQRKAMLGAKLRMLNLRRNGIEQLAGIADPTAEIASLERELKATVDEFREAKTSLATLTTRLDHVNQIFNAPTEHVKLERIRLRVNRMGHKVTEESSEPASELDLRELSIGDGLKAVIVFARCPRAELPPRESLSARAAREVL